MPKKERDQRQVLATNLELFVNQGVLSLLIILRHIKMSRASGLAYLANLHGFEKIVGDLLEVWPGEKKDTLPLMQQAILGGIESGTRQVIAKILERVSDEDLAKLLERWMSADTEVGRRLTYEQIAHAFAPPELSACVRKAMAMVDIMDDAPDADVVEEVVDVDPTPAEPPAGTSEPPTDK
jgi:hypothetical protein